jgi:hypothetical protein
MPMRVDATASTMSKHPAVSHLTAEAAACCAARMIQQTGTARAAASVRPDAIAASERLSRAIVVAGERCGT